jgi:hypothetical protein
MFQALQLIDTALDVRTVRLIFSVEIAKLSLKFGAKPAQAASPASMATDYRCVNQ